jgi:AcrR family transcriptional regulator
MVRNKEGTKLRILQAVGKLVAESGFSSLGINAIAREAGVDKVLIYRYFTDLPTLLRTFGQEGNYLASTSAPPGFDKIESLPELLSYALIFFQKELRDRPITQEIILWDLLEDNELTQELIDVREKTRIARTKFFYDKFDIPADQDVTALMTILGCGITYLILRSKNKPIYAGLDFSTEDGWERLESIVSKIIHAVVSDTQLKPLQAPSKKTSAKVKGIVANEKRQPQQYEEIDQILDIPFEGTRVYKDTCAKVTLIMVLRLLGQNCGQLSIELVRDVTALSLNQLEALGDALLKFKKVKDLEKWLQENASEDDRSLQGIW